MRNIFVIMSVAGAISNVNAQILIDDKSGDPIGNNLPQIGGGKNLSLIRLSTGSQSLGFTHFISTGTKDAADYAIHEFSLKTRPTDGIGPLISNGQFAAGIKLNYAYTKVNVFSGSRPGGYIDWGGFSASYDIDKYTLAKKDTPYASQVYSENFNGLSFNVFYNGLINSKWIFHSRVGYSYLSNIEELAAVNANDVVFVSTDPSGTSQREVVKTKAAKQGSYKEYDGYPVVLSITRATRSDDPKSADAKEAAAATKLRVGFTAFIKNVISERRPRTTTGVVIFLAKQDKSGVRSPVLGVSIQAKDPFDVLKKGNSLQNRLGVGFTTTISL